MEYFDAVVIGGGILGCFTARNLRRWQISVLLIEAEPDVCSGITRANSGICYAGYDNKTGSLKASMTVRGNARMEELCAQLDVPFSRCGSLLVTYDPQAVSRLERKLEQGIRNGVPGLKLLSGAEAEAMEPMLKPGVAAALYAPTTGVINPWQLGIAAYENARLNGCSTRLGTAVTAITKTQDGYQVTTDTGSVSCRMVFNCAGLQADKVQQLLFPPRIRIHPDGAEYLVLDPLAQKPNRVIFHQAHSCGKGITAIPCTEGNLLISGIRKPIEQPFATTQAGLQALHEDVRSLLPEADLTKVIRSFGAVRPNPYALDGESLHDFCIDNPAPGFFSLIAIKTPGLTCADELGLHLAQKAADYIHAPRNPNFDPNRKGISCKDGEIICQCQSVTKGEILEAIARGAVSVDGVKRRVGASMGRCQGSRCRYAIEALLKEHRNGTL